MEPENTTPDVAPAKEPSRLHQVTPLSKYLAMALFIILPFVGGWIGYVYAPEKVVEVVSQTLPPENERVFTTQENKRVPPSNQSQNTIYTLDFVSEPSTSTKRLLLSRQQLFDQEDYLYRSFGLTKQQENGLFTGALYLQQNENTPLTYTYYQGNGISLLLPYNERYGYPYFRLTPYDELDTRIMYGEIHPCPAGCMESGGMTSSISLYPAGSLQDQIEKLEANGSPGYPASCEPRILNKNTEGIFCTSQVHMADRVLFIEGSKYLYGIRGGIADENVETSVVYKSIIVE